MGYFTETRYVSPPSHILLPSWGGRMFPRCISTKYDFFFSSIYSSLTLSQFFHIELSSPFFLQFSKTVRYFPFAMIKSPKKNYSKIIMSNVSAIFIVRSNFPTPINFMTGELATKWLVLRMKIVGKVNENDKKICKRRSFHKNDCQSFQDSKILKPAPNSKGTRKVAIENLWNHYCIDSNTYKYVNKYEKPHIFILDDVLDW